MGRLVARAPTGQQCHLAFEAVQVRAEGHAVALQELQVGVAGHQASKGVIGTACYRVYQLLGGLGERHGGGSGGDLASSPPSHIVMVKTPLPRPLRNSRDTQNWVSFISWKFL